ncbi:hypothetical protein SFRURICE_013185, partial [Spodoptera frugiperda]
MKRMYHTISTAPYLRSSFQPFAWVATTRKITVENKKQVFDISINVLNLTSWKLPYYFLPSVKIFLIVLVASLTSLRCVYAFPQEKIAEEGKSRGIPEEPGQNSTNTCSPSGEETAPVNNTNQSQNESMD